MAVSLFQPDRRVKPLIATLFVIIACGICTAPVHADPTGTTVMLRAQGKKIHGINWVRLNWRGATSSVVEIYRCFPGPTCETFVPTANDSDYYLSAGTGRARDMYRVCDHDTGACSSIVTVSLPQ
jgi:hypothetical protein